jgi:undecaprenyl-diphosphatase
VASPSDENFLASAGPMPLSDLSGVSNDGIRIVYHKPGLGFHVTITTMLLIQPLPVDLTISRFIQHFQPDWLTGLLKAVSLLMSPEILVVVGLGLAIVAYNRHRPTRAAMILIVTAGNILTPILKLWFDRPRPSASLINVLVTESDRSLPSGHAMAAWLFAVVILTLVWRQISTVGRWWLGLILLIMIAVVGYSRLYLGVHWFSDVMAGYGFALIWTGISYFFIRPLLLVQRRTK